MRMTNRLRDRLVGMFRKKMFSLLADDDRHVATWSEYLRSIGCERVAGGPPPKGFIIVDDPIWHDNKILVPRDLADRALVLEYLP